MAGLPRKPLFPFATSATNQGQFGSAQLGTKITTTDPSVVQGISGGAPSAAWNQGWLDAVISGLALPPLEEMQGVQFVHSYMLSYLLTRGLAEWDSITTYNQWDFCKKTGTWQLYGSLIDSNTGNALPSAVSNSNWQYLGDLSNLNGIAATNPIKGSRKNLKSAWASNTTFTITADEIILQNSSHVTVKEFAVSLTNTITSSGANGLDTGSPANNTWYYSFIIFDGTTVSSLCSLSATAPTLPSGYTYWARVGTFITDSSAHIIGFMQVDRKVAYIVGNNLSGSRTIASGTAGNYSGPVYAAASISSYVPPTAVEIDVVVVASSSTSAGQVTLAPNNNYGNYINALNSYTPGSSVGAGGTAKNIIIESSNVYWISNVNQGAILCAGYTDNI